MRIAQIVQAIGILTHSPLMGRPAYGGKRELVIGRGASLYVALYRFDAVADTVYIIALRHQRESQYRRDW